MDKLADYIVFAFFYALLSFCFGFTFFVIFNYDLEQIASLYRESGYGNIFYGPIEGSATINVLLSILFGLACFANLWYYTKTCEVKPKLKELITWGSPVKFKIFVFCLLIPFVLVIVNRYAAKQKVKVLLEAKRER